MTGIIAFKPLGFKLATCIEVIPPRGGITSMQVASLNPKGLKAIIPVTSSVDRYYDDAGYFLGCLVGQTIGWGVEMDSLSTRPPDPDLVDELIKSPFQPPIQ